MRHSEFVKKWKLQQIKKPEGKVVLSRPEFMFASELHVPLMADPKNKNWTLAKCQTTKEAFALKLDEFWEDYCKIEDLI